MGTIVGLDAGNSEASLTFTPNKQGAALTLPSYIGSGNLAELLRIRGGAGGEKLEADEFVLELGGRSTFVGTLAIEQSRDATSARGDVSRYWSGHTLRLLCTLAGAAFKGDPALRIVTGLPVSVWSKAAAKQVQQALVGEHCFKLNGKPRRLVVEGVMVLMEGAGALAREGTGDDVPQAVVDVGGRTTDLFWTQGMRPQPERCKAAPIGIEKAGDLLCAQFQQRYGRELRRVELRGVFRALASGQPLPPLFVDGKRVDVQAEAQSAIAAVGEEIASYVAATWSSGESGKVASDAARVLLVGGGAHYIAPHLKAIIPHIKSPRHPELANAQGYLGVGMQVPEAAWQKLRG